MNLHEASFFLIGWCWNNQRILQEFSWCEIALKWILFWEFHCYHFPLWLMRNACETMCCSRDLLFLNPFIKATKQSLWTGLFWVGFLWGFFCHRHLWWPQRVLGARPALEVPEGLSIPMPGYGAQLRMAKPFWDVQWNCSSPLLQGCNNTSNALSCTSPS